jgi:hypothetical protein
VHSDAVEQFEERLFSVRTAEIDLPQKLTLSSALEASELLVLKERFKLARQQCRKFLTVI